MAGELQETQELEFHRKLIALVECIKEIGVVWSIDIFVLTVNHEKVNYQRNSRKIASQPKNQIDLGLLSNILGNSLNIAELKSLAFSLSIDYENLEGSTKSEKIQSLLEYCSRHGCIESLVEKYSQTRSDIELATLALQKAPNCTNSLDSYHQSM